MLNHSKEYTGALLASWVEFWLEAFLFPDLKRQPAVVLVGVFLALVGHWFRVGAMWTAGSNFNHEIMRRVSERAGWGEEGEIQERWWWGCVYGSVLCCVFPLPTHR